MAYVGCQDGSIRCVNPSGKDIELENYIICKPHADCVRKVYIQEFSRIGYHGEEYGRIELGVFGWSRQSHVDL